MYLSWSCDLPVILEEPRRATSSSMPPSSLETLDELIESMTLNTISLSVLIWLILVLDFGLTSPLKMFRKDRGFCWTLSILEENVLCFLMDLLLSFDRHPEENGKEFLRRMSFITDALIIDCDLSWLWLLPLTTKKMFINWPWVIRTRILDWKNDWISMKSWQPSQMKADLTSETTIQEEEAANHRWQDTCLLCSESTTTTDSDLLLQDHLSFLGRHHFTWHPCQEEQSQVVVWHRFQGKTGKRIRRLCSALHLCPPCLPSSSGEKPSQNLW